MIKLADIVKEIGDAQPAINAQPASNYSISQEFVNFIRSLENADKLGYDKNKSLWIPNPSAEGGMPTIAYGHKIKNKAELENYQKGISDRDALKLLVADLNIANKRVHEYIKKKYNVSLTLNQRQEEMLTEFAFNLGGLDKFPKFVDAVLRNNVEGMRKEYKRNYTSSTGERKSLDRRNQLFFDRFLK